MSPPSSPHPLREDYLPAVRVEVTDCSAQPSAHYDQEGSASSTDPRNADDKATASSGGLQTKSGTAADGGAVRLDGDGRVLESAPRDPQRGNAGESSGGSGDAGQIPSATPTRPPLAVLPSNSDSTGYSLASLPPSTCPAEPSPALSVLSTSVSTSALPSPSESAKPILSFTPPSNATQSASASNSAGSGLGLGSWKSRSGKLGATFEKKRLAALGFEEELSRDYDFWASAGLTICNIGGFPGTVLAVLTAMDTGGGSMYSVAWPISGLFMLCLAAVLGEMASTWPVSGAMFTWTFRLCRSSRRLDPWARFLSWIVGSFLLVSHILLQVVISWQFAHNLLGTIGLYTHLKYSNWVTLAICWAILVLCALIVSSPLSRSPWLWRGAGACIIIFFLTLNITLLSQAKEIKSAKFVFGDYRNATGFSSRSYVYMLGWVLTCVASGMEAAAHIAEDTKSPARTVPLSMFWSVAATYIMGWISICVLLATMDVSGLDPTLQPSIALIANSIPRGHTTLVLLCVLASFVFQAIAQLLATSRYMFALARESALPCSDFLRKLSQKDKLPLHAIWVVAAIAGPILILLCINSRLISIVVLEAAGISCMVSYAAPVMLYLGCPNDVLVGDGRVQWTLRRWSKPAAVAATIFSSVFMIMLCLPTGWPVTPLKASYAAAVLLGVPLIGSIAWVLYGNARYAGPIKTTTRWTIGAEVDLPRTGSGSRSRATGAAGKGKTPLPASGAAGPTPPPQLNELTTSADHGRSAHVFSSFPTLMTHDGPPHSSESGWTDGTGSEGMSRSSWEEETGGVSGLTSGTGTETGTETGWTGSTGTETRWTSSHPSRRGRTAEEEGIRGRERSAGRRS